MFNQQIQLQVNVKNGISDGWTIAYSFLNISYVRNLRRNGCNKNCQ